MSRNLKKAKAMARARLRELGVLPADIQHFLRPQSTGMVLVVIDHPFDISERVLCDPHTSLACAMNDVPF